MAELKILILVMDIGQCLEFQNSINLHSTGRHKKVTP